jgi:hypothetical protein
MPMWSVMLSNGKEPQSNVVVLGWSVEHDAIYWYGTMLLRRRIAEKEVKPEVHKMSRSIA